MKYLHNLLLTILIFICYSGFGQQISRSVIGAAGSFETGSSSRLNWTLGELCVETMASGNTIFTAGFQQGDLLFTQIYEQNGEIAEITLYPNPAKSFILVSSYRKPVEKIWIIDMQGNILLEGTACNKLIHLDISSISAGNCILLCRLRDEKKLEAIRFEKTK